MEFMVYPERVKSTAEEIGLCKRTVHVAWSEVESVRKKCAVQGKSRGSVVSSLRRISDDISDIETSVSRLSEALKEIAETYEKTEKQLAGSPENETGDKEKWDWSAINKLIKDIIGKAGPVGAFASLIGGLFMEGDWDSKLISSGKLLAKIVGDGAKMVSAGTNAGWWKALVGLDKVTDTSVNVGEKLFTKTFKKQFTDLSFKGATKTADKVKVGAKWFGHILTFAGNYVENQKERETEGISAGRAWVETGVETGADILVGAVATSAATAVFGVGAPVVLVGAATVGITWAANEGCKAIFGGRDIGEVAADVLCGDGAEVWNDAKKSVKSAAKAVSKTVSKAADNVGKAVKSVGKSLQNIGTKWSKSVFSFA